MYLDAGPKPGKMGKIAAGRASGVKLFSRLYKCVLLINPYRIGRGPGYQTVAGVAQQGTRENYATAKHSEDKRRKRGGRRVKNQREVWKERHTLVRVGTLNKGGKLVREIKG